MNSMHGPDGYDAQYDARAGINEQAAICQSWVDRSRQARAALPCQLDLAYGRHRSERLAIFGAAAKPSPGRRGGRRVRGAAPLLIYIHGGCWRALDKSDPSFVATPFVDAGARVVLPNYPLAPAVSVRHIVLQMVQAVAWVCRNIAQHGGDPQRIVVAGHSAGADESTEFLRQNRLIQQAWGASVVRVSKPCPCATT